MFLSATYKFILTNWYMTKVWNLQFVSYPFLLATIPADAPNIQIQAYKLTSSEKNVSWVPYWQHCPTLWGVQCLVFNYPYPSWQWWHSWYKCGLWIPGLYTKGRSDVPWRMSQWIARFLLYVWSFCLRWTFLAWSQVHVDDSRMCQWLQTSSTSFERAHSFP